MEDLDWGKRERDARNGRQENEEVKKQRKIARSTFMSSDITKFCGGGDEKEKEKGRGNWKKRRREMDAGEGEEKDEEKRIFSKAIQDIHKLVYSDLSRVEQKQRDAARFKALGGKAPKNQKMPYNLLLKIKAAKHRKLDELKAKEAELGVILTTSRKASAMEASSSKRRAVKKRKQREMDGKFFGFSP
eukprot:GHVS01025132.1.p1 GENE.GHVS01025132.1~~GHVS01025132.1.p1  ORF type:complete len:188 (+),score=44.10 GHVS01025132.1:171-734(+)